MHSDSAEMSSRQSAHLHPFFLRIPALSWVWHYGRSPIIGPLTIGAVRVRKSQLEDINARDSKDCTANQIEELYEEISQNYDVLCARIRPPEIDGRVTISPELDMNLNDWECYYMLSLINDYIVKGKQVDTVLIDNMDKSKEAFLDRARKIMNVLDHLEFVIDDINWSIRHKYDESSKLVGAASIVAKHWRDSEMDMIRNKRMEDVGSGQVSDPTTQKYVYDHLDDSDNKYIRFNWKTVDRLRNSRLCPECGHNAVVKWGEGYKCVDCQHKFTVEEV